MTALKRVDRKISHFPCRYLWIYYKCRFKKISNIWKSFRFYCRILWVPKSIKIYILWINFVNFYHFWKYFPVFFVVSIGANHRTPTSLIGVVWYYNLLISLIIIAPTHWSLRPKNCVVFHNLYLFLINKNVNNTIWSWNDKNVYHFRNKTV